MHKCNDCDQPAVGVRTTTTPACAVHASPASHLELELEAARQMARHNAERGLELEARAGAARDLLGDALVALEHKRYADVAKIIAAAGAELEARR